MSNIISKYIGIFKQPIQISSSKSTIYGISDDGKKELIMILLSPSSYVDAYKVASLSQYQTIKLVVPSLDMVYISDIFNLFMSIYQLHQNMNNIQWIFPNKPLIETSVEFEMNQVISNIYQHSIDSNISFELKRNLLMNEDNTEDISRDIYDILIHDGNKNIYFSQYLTINKAEELYNDSTIDEIHIACSTTIYGGLTFMQLINIDSKYISKFVANSFSSVDEYLTCVNNKYKVGEVNYNDFI